jgi:hypothetical protein
MIRKLALACKLAIDYRQKLGATWWSICGAVAASATTARLSTSSTQPLMYAKIKQHPAALQYLCAPVWSNRA